ncbi:hypothetical protein [Streptomyces goshikiensis]|uniref:hypothetical protein n=1 Tax=Streptomyces goshikiensis TaxID=1942 RepID=UPI002ADFD40B|nr:hypothetical protein [Streptomyces goshikiensis]
MPVPGHPYAPPARPRNRTAVILVSIFGGLLLLAGCGAVLNVLSRESGDRGTADRADSAPSASAGATPRPAPQPEIYTDIKLTSDYHLRFADAPLEPVEYSKDDLFYSCGFGSCDFATFSAKLAQLDSGSDGSLQACRQETRFATRIPVEALSKGGRMCVRTDKGSIAVITYKGSSPSNSDATSIERLPLTGCVAEPTWGGKVVRRGGDADLGRGLGCRHAGVQVVEKRALAFRCEAKSVRPDPCFGIDST